MDTYVSFRGVRTDSLGLYIARGGMPSHKKAEQRHAEYEIPGRDGAVHVLDGYNAMDLTVMLQMLGDTADMRRIINAWADGSGDLYTSDDTAHVWKATVLKNVIYERAEYGGKMYDTATVKFRCQPYMYERTPQVVTLTAAGTLTNAGNAVALPKIVVNGTGDCTVTIGGSTVKLFGLKGAVTIDTESGYVYSATGAVAMEGEFPVLGLGNTAVSFTGSVTSLVITPNWRWI